MREMIRKAIAEVLEQEAIHVSEQEISVEHTKYLKNGDYYSAIAKKLTTQDNVDALAKKIRGALVGKIPGVENIIVQSGFINFFLSFESVTAQIEKARGNDMWGANETLKNKKIMVEYTDPNPFKEFHIGHLMSNAIGESISRLLQFSGAEVKRANYQGDVGPHVAKAIWGKMKSPVLTWGQAYAAGSADYEQHTEEIDAINQKIYEKSDPEINTLYDSGRKASLEHFEELYKILGTTFDYYFFESETAGKGLEIVHTHPEIFETSDGAVVYKGEKAGLHTRVFVTSKGLPTYETKELGLAEMKAEAWDFDMSITVTAHEQADYFEVVLAAMKEVLPNIAGKIVHISHGMMRLPSGKMSSRTGDVITGESLLNDLIAGAKIRAAESRAENKEQLASSVAVAAIKYQILKQASGKDITFDRERSLSLEGDSGPYLQYAHARTRAIVEKAAEQNITPRFDERAPVTDLPRLLHRFPEIVARASREKEPHHLTTYLLEVAALFNRWYAEEHILDGSNTQAHKVAITSAVSHSLKNGLWLLGIPAPEKM